MRMLRRYAIDLAIFPAVFKGGTEFCLLGLFQMTFTVTVLHDVLHTRSAFPEPRTILHAAANMRY